MTSPNRILPVGYARALAFSQCCAIFFLSSLPEGPEIPVDIPGIDKAAHFVLYFLLGALLVLSQSERNYRWKAAIFFSVTISAVYGALDEFHQALLPLRIVSNMDFLADLAGAFCGAAVMALWRRKAVAGKGATKTRRH